MPLLISLVTYTKQSTPEGYPSEETGQIDNLNIKANVQTARDRASIVCTKIIEQSFPDASTNTKEKNPNQVAKAIPPNLFTWR